MRCVGVVFLLSIFCVIVQDAGACKCAVSENHDKYCHAEFGLKAQVVKEISSSPSGDRVYRIITGVKQFRTLKGNFANVDLTKVYTPFSGAACGVTLQPGKVYLLSGSIDKSKSVHRLRIQLCGWSQLWNTLTYNKNFVTSGYLTECP